MTVVIFASPRRHGFTGELLDSFLGEYAADGIEFFDAYELAAKPCTGCGVCARTGECVYRDLDRLFDKIRECDNIVFATPVYNFSVPAPLKAILDRFQVFYNNPLKDRERKLSLVITSGRSGEQSIPMTQKMIFCAAESINAVPVRTAARNNTDMVTSDGN